jgi:hypothetical protein
VWGPVPLASLPDMAAEPPRRDGGELLLSKQFLDGCLEEYSVKLPGQDNNQGRVFTEKHLNIVDPLRPSNNLRRSVNQRREALDKGRWSTARIGSSYKGHADAREQLVTVSQTFHAQLVKKEALIAQLQEELAALSGRCHSKIRELGRYLSIEFCPRGQFEST